MANFSFCFGQTYTLTVKDSVKAKENSRLYNLYYLSKEIAKKNYSKKPNFKALNALNILISDKKINTKYHKLVFSFVEGISDYKKEIIRETSGMLLVGNFTEFKSNLISKDDKKKYDNKLSTLTKEYNNLKISELKKIKDTLKKEYSLNDLQRLMKKMESFTSNLERYYSKKNDSINFNLNLIETDIGKKIDDKQKEYDNSIKNFAEEYANDVVSIETSQKDNYNNFLVSNSEQIKTQQIQINSQIQIAQAQTGSSGIKIPSQSQMIEAMAIFLAKRAKQEAAIWFMDQIRLKMNNPMIFDVFPETIKVMEGVENYKVPTFNTTWKYAIAKDFVEMPKNLVESPWVENVIFKENKDNHSILKQSIDFGYDLNRLMTEQYNYRDIIKHFYINQRAIDKGQKLNMLINNSNTLLYIITNEFFAIETIDGKDVYRLLSYEEIAGLNEQEFKILVELIDLKYGSKFANFNILENVKLENREEINKWMGNILTSLSQLDKIRNDLKTKKDEIKDDLASKNFYNVWSILNQVTDNISNCSFLDKTDDKKNLRKEIKDKIKFIQTGMSVYEHFQNNDYVGAANETFTLMNLIRNNYNGEYIVKNYIYQFGKEKQISLNYLKETNKFKITNKSNYDYVHIRFENNDLVIEKPDKTEINLNDFQIIAKYITNNNNVKQLKELYGKNMHSKIQQIQDLSKTFNLDDSEMLKMINSTYIFKKAMTDNINVKEVLKNLQFTVGTVGSEALADNHDNYTKQLTNLLSFFGDVLSVKDEHQLAGIIDSYALPPTSYKLKRKQPSSIDLNAYVGAFGGGLMSLKSTIIGSQPVYGITAPIGIAFTWSRNGWYDNYGFTVDVVDLGNVVNHYLVKPGEDYAKDVHFSEVFSLGTTFLMGIKNSPFVISGGFRFQPYNTGKDANNKVFDAGIYHLGVKIDIPLIHLSGKDF